MRRHNSLSSSNVNESVHLRCRKDYRGTLIVYAFVCALWLPLNLWMMPWNALAIGDVSASTCGPTSWPPQCLWPNLLAIRRLSPATLAMQKPLARLTALVAPQLTKWLTALMFVPWSHAVLLSHQITWLCDGALQHTVSNFMRVDMLVGCMLQWRFHTNLFN